MLAHHTETQIRVTCDGSYSHLFDLQPLTLSKKDADQLLLISHPEQYGRVLYNALFPHGTPAYQTLKTLPERILLIAKEDDLDAIPWEYSYGSTGFLILNHHFVRGLPPEQRIPPYKLDTGLHIVAIPSNPLSLHIVPLNIDAEWMRLKEITESLPFALTLERVRPPTIEQMRNAVASQRHRVVHFMGHGGQLEDGAVLCFEKDNGELDPVTAQKFALRVRKTAFLVTLNACVSATAGSTPFSNLAATLIRQQIPYALGMRLSVDDDDARAFSRTFYSDLARGVPVEEALLQARATLANSSLPWAVGVPVLYTSLATPAAGFIPEKGRPIVVEPQPRMQIYILPRAEGGFQGRVEDLKRLGDFLTGDDRPALLTIHGGGGQGKTALAREAVERFAYAWPGGVWAITLENLPDRARFTAELAQFLDIPAHAIDNPREIEYQVMKRLAAKRTLIVLDNAETLVEAIEANSATAIQLGQFLQQLPASSACLLATSRLPLGWSGEIAHEIGGLETREGVNLFLQCAPQRTREIEQAMAWDLSKKLEGHPLGLRLLGSAFNSCALSFADFLRDYEEQLRKAENKYRDLTHRHRSLYACIETSLRYLNDDVRDLLSGLWIFHQPFLADTAVAIFDPGAEKTEHTFSAVRTRLQTLQQHSLLTFTSIPTDDGTFRLYHLLPTTRIVIGQSLPSVYPRQMLLSRFGKAYANLARFIQREFDFRVGISTIARLLEGDIVRLTEKEMELALSKGEQGSYFLDVAEILFRLGESERSLELLERALECAQQQEQSLLYSTYSTMAIVHQTIGKRQGALVLLERALLRSREENNHTGEAIALHNLAGVYHAIGQPERELPLLEQALSLLQEEGNQRRQAITLHSIAGVYLLRGQPRQALQLLGQALPLAEAAQDRNTEAYIIHNMGRVYQATGMLHKALQLLEQALPIWRAIGDQYGEVSTRNAMAEISLKSGQPKQAQDLFELTLSMSKRLEDRSGEGTSLNGKASVYQASGQWQQALELFEQALLIDREIENRSGESVRLSNIAAIYHAMGQSARALSLCEEALALMRKTENRSGEVTVLNNTAKLYQDMGQPEQAVRLYQEALSLGRKIENRPVEVAILNGTAQAYEALDQYQQALYCSEEALSLVKEIGDQGEEAVTLNIMAGVYCHMGQVKQALAQYEEALRLTKECKNLVGEATTLYNMAEIYQVSGHPQQAIDLLTQALHLVQEAENQPEEAAILNSMAESYISTGQWQQAMGLLERALPITRAKGNQDQEALVLHNMALVYQSTSQFQQALNLYKEVLLLRRAGKNSAGEAATLSNIAMIHYVVGQIPTALRLYEQALQIMRRAKNRRGIKNQAIEASMLSNIATAYRSSGLLPPALRMYEEALDIKRAVGDRLGEAITLSNIGSIFEAQGELERALSFYKSALSIVRAGGNRPNEAITLNNMAGVYLAQGQFQRALALYEESLPIMKAVGDRNGEAAVLIGIGRIHQVFGQPHLTLNFYEQALSIRKETGNRLGEVSCLVRLSFLLYQDFHRYQEAIATLEQAIRILEQTGLPQDSAEYTLEELRQELRKMKKKGTQG